MLLFIFCTKCDGRSLLVLFARARYARSAHGQGGGYSHYLFIFNSKKKKDPSLYLNVALVPPSAGTSGAVASGCLPDGPQAQGPLKGVNAIFEQGMGRCQLDRGLLLMDRERPWNCNHGGGGEMRRK